MCRYWPLPLQTHWAQCHHLPRISPQTRRYFYASIYWKSLIVFFTCRCEEELVAAMVCTWLCQWWSSLLWEQRGLHRTLILRFQGQKFVTVYVFMQAFSNKEPPKGVIHLSSITKVHQNIKKRDHLIKNIFTLETPGRNYYFQAPSIITMDQWMACLTMPLSSLKLWSLIKN